LFAWEVRIVKRQGQAKKRVLPKEAIKRFAAESTKASAALERRTVPTAYVRSDKIIKYLAEHPPR
jgi:hypothetical protein